MSGWSNSYQLKWWVPCTSRFEEFHLPDSSCKWWPGWEFSLTISGWTAKVHRLTESKQSRAQHVKALTDLGDSGAHPLILCACQEKGVKTSWGAGMTPELLFLSLFTTSTPPLDNPAWHVELDGTEVCWHPRNGDLSTLYKANQYEVFPKTKHASDYQMMYSCLQYR